MARISSRAIESQIDTTRNPLRVSHHALWYYPCTFVATDRSGSFEISADGYPTYILIMGEPGFAFGFLNLGNRNIPLAGQYVRQRDDGACWSNRETNTKICAW